MDEASVDERAARLADPAVRALLAVLNEQLEQLEEMPGPVSDLALTAVAGLAEIYGQALGRALDLADPAMVERMLADELIGHLLALHGIHPEPIPARLARVIDKLGGALGGTVELVRVEGDTAVLRVSAGGSDIGPLVHRAVLTAVPELADVTIVPAGRPGSPAFVPLEALMRTTPSGRLP